MEDIIIYTAIFGDKDNLKEPQEKHPRCKYICFTDNEKLKSDIWKIKVKKPMFPDNPNLSAKYYKILPHIIFQNENIDKSIWIDATRKITNNLDWFIQNIAMNFKIDDKPLFFKHKQRNCIYDEIEKCIELKKDKKEILLQQKEKYQEFKYPKNNGLYNCSIIIRKHFNKNFISLNEKWWEEILKTSKRDQISLPFILWYYNLEINIINKKDFNPHNNKVFKYTKHLW